jgi:hypothetical protein
MTISLGNFGHAAMMLALMLSVVPAGRAFADGATDEDCRRFHAECVDATRQGEREAGICKIERLECALPPGDDSTSGVGKRFRQDDRGGDRP